ncbi:MULTISPECIES: DUF732 domain-containing protein [Mycobacterium]|uniref:DUF732 domain-containing protein n=1 Tax=Mycobacterium TaxID=1763 RepID=UPI001EEFEA4F|nr:MULTISPECIES: DUF732 domain-containing protein [Mycobacterium]BDB45243.1 hypothetical protein IWGMT90018_56890 [Mycobacterium kiyosense]BDE16716.1 hypothetical protein MKCMC460_55760 [Mycobacterium sp. 20KCMC460]GLB90473.1 hypothetical protein SRL2020130_32900 [Mycobacterium kiyosense]GLC02985.1 hypothetical protein SRL2020400_35760 [Mycobacterium kiyosense]GLC08449.1 hypothetical protein SRL2020411_30950 [Mycobacterium kiyosense]
MRKRLLIAVAFGLLGPLASVSAAHADANDAKFLSTLRSEGITDHVPDDYAIQAAHAVCDNLDSGKSPKEMAAEMVDKAGMTAYHAGYFVGASIDDYCPKHLPELLGKKSS